MSYYNTDRCKKSCPAGSPCCLSREVILSDAQGRRVLRHTLHICSDPACTCHSMERYAPSGNEAVAP